MLKIITSLLLVYSICLMSNLPSLAQSRQQPNRLQVGHLPNDDPKISLKEFFAKETEKSKSAKPFTQADVDRLEKESINQTTKRNNLSTTTKVVIGVGIAAVVILVVVLATRGGDDDPPLPCDFPPICN